MKHPFVLIVLIFTAALTVASCADKGTCNAESTDYTPARTIDFEHHFYLTEFIDFMRNRTEYPLYRDLDVISERNQLHSAVMHIVMDTYMKENGHKRIAAYLEHEPK